MSAADPSANTLGKTAEDDDEEPLAQSGMQERLPVRRLPSSRALIAGGALAVVGLLVLKLLLAGRRPHCWQWRDGFPTGEAEAFHAQVAALQRAPRRLAGAYFGGKEFCSGRWAPDSFTGVEEAERGLGAWLRTLQPVLAHFEDEAERRRQGVSQACDTYPMAPQAVFRGLLPQGPACASLELLGKDDGSPAWRDGAKYACGLSALAEGCIVVSLGSQNDWRFEEAVFDRLPQCSVLTLDCTLEAKVPERIQGRVRFEKLCVAAEDSLVEGRQYLSWASVSRRFLPRPPALLKMDIEGYEYGVLRSIFAAPDASQPSQLLVELHWRDIGPPISLRRWGEVSSGELLAFSLQLLDAGYRLAHADWETFCPHCIEVMAVKLFCTPP